MLIINQDRDLSMEYNPAKDYIQPLAMFYNGTFMGVNLMLKGELLGTFDNMDEAFQEILKIVNFDYEIYIISGYSCWQEWDELKLINRE